jgi:hypothetical protein
MLVASDWDTVRASRILLSRRPIENNFRRQLNAAHRVLIIKPVQRDL